MRRSHHSDALAEYTNRNFPYATGVDWKITGEQKQAARQWLSEHYRRWAIVDGKYAFDDAKLATLFKLRFG